MKKYAFILLLLFPLILNAEYYVAPNGNNANNGSLTTPFKTVSFAITKLKAGDILNIREGIYNESFMISTSGTSINPIIVKAYLNEKPIIDGNGISVGAGGSIISIYGQYVIVKGLIVRNSTYFGIAASAPNCIISNCTVYDCQESAIGGYANNTIIEYNTVYNAAMTNFNGLATQNWASGISCARNNISGCIMRHNIVHDVWGEGISCFETTNTIIEDNTIYDFYSVGLYVSDAPNTLVQRNFIYRTKAMSNGSMVGIGHWNEKTISDNANNKFINNIAYGCRRNFYHEGAVFGLEVCNNTFVNSIYYSCVEINGGSTITGYFKNNIIVQEDDLMCIDVQPGNTLAFSNNLFNKSYDTDAKGEGDITGDPLFARGDVFNPFYYKLQSNSPAINKGIILVNTDFFDNTRTIPDIGAIEYMGITRIDVTSLGRHNSFKTIVADGNIKLFFDNPMGDLNIYNLIGIKVVSLKVSSSYVNISNIPKGLYLVMYNSEVQKIILK